MPDVGLPMKRRASRYPYPSRPTLATSVTSMEDVTSNFRNFLADSGLGFEPSEGHFAEFTYEGDSPGILRQGALAAAQVEHRLFPTSSDQTHSEPSSTLRLLLYRCEAAATPVLPGSGTTFARIYECMHIPNYFFHVFVNSFAHISHFTNQRDSDDQVNGLMDGYLFKIGVHASGFCTILLSYERNTGVTTAIILAQTDFLKFESFRQAQRIASIENTLGQHTYVDRPQGDPNSADFDWLTKSLNSAGTSIGVIEMRTRSGIWILEECLRHTEAAMGTTLASIKHSLDSRYIGMQEEIRRIHNSAQSMLFQVKHEERRVQLQLSVIYNFAQQKNNRISIQLAYESTRIADITRHDTVAMKTIAILTMAFLPGTFIAALFDVSFFNWDATGSQRVTNSRFWYYWAVVIPLTVVVFVSWGLFQRCSLARKNRKEGLDGRP